MKTTATTLIKAENTISFLAERKRASTHLANATEQLSNLPPQFNINSCSFAMFSKRMQNTMR